MHFSSYIYIYIRYYLNIFNSNCFWYNLIVTVSLFLNTIQTELLACMYKSSIILLKCTTLSQQLHNALRTVTIWSIRLCGSPSKHSIKLIGTCDSRIVYTNNPFNVDANLGQITALVYFHPVELFFPSGKRWTLHLSMQHTNILLDIEPPVCQYDIPS